MKYDSYFQQIHVFAVWYFECFGSFDFIFNY